MTSLRKAAGTVKEGAEFAAAVALSQPRVTGSGSRQQYDNPWPEWQVRLETAVHLFPSSRRCLRYVRKSNKPFQRSCLTSQERSLSDVLSWSWKRRGLAPATGHLLDHPKPSPADFQRLFPVSLPNYCAMANPPGNTLQCIAKVDLDVDAQEQGPADQDLQTRLKADHPCLKPNLVPVAGDAVQAFWLGHASCLVQMEGVTFLTDPVFSQRCSPLQWMGPK